MLKCACKVNIFVKIIISSLLVYYCTCKVNNVPKLKIFQKLNLKVLMLF